MVNSPNRLPSKAALHKLFQYDGKNLFRRKSGSENLKARDRDGYIIVAIDCLQYRVHRVIWKMVHGVDPEFMDHINGTRDDNRIENLRSVTQRENNMNSAIGKNNKTGCHGVSWDKEKGKWNSKITVNYKQHNLGYYDCLLAAVLVRREAENQYGFHENHGRSAA